MTIIDNIKYRAWDKVRNKMFDVTLINFQDKLVNMIYDNKSDWEKSREIIKDYNVPFSRIKLMQCLEVKDKKGKEIWEGDIVKLSFPESTEFTVKMATILGVVYWNEYGANFDVEQITKDTYQTKMGDYISDEDELSFHSNEGQEFLWEWLEVVGNIYEYRKLYEKELKSID